MIIDLRAMKVLNEFFIFDQIFDLIDFDHDMNSLYVKLEQLKKNHYEPNYRFIFLHYDTEYYISDKIPGVTLMNLQRVLTALDIPNYFCLILSQQNLQSYLDWLRDHETNDSCSITCITNQLHTPIHQSTYNKNLSLNNGIITKKYISLNRVTRFHRRVLVSLLKDKNLLNEGMVSYGPETKSN